MPTHLGECLSRESVRVDVGEICKKYNILLNPPADVAGCTDLTYCLKLSFVDDDGYTRSCFLTSFPGNCSSIILSQIECLLTNKEFANRVIKCAVEIGNYFHYGALFITGVGNGSIAILKEVYGFEILTNDVFNPHSRNNNFFALLRLTGD